MFAQAIQRIRRRLLDRCVLRPTREPMDCGDQEKHVYRAGPWTLDVFYQANQRASNSTVADLLVLKFPGTGGRAERSSPFPMTLLESQNAAVEMWTWNPPGYGGSAGVATLSDIASASIALCEQLLRERPAKRVWLVGNSLGCATAMNVAAHGNLSDRSVGLILRNAPPLKPVFRAVASRYPLGKWAHPWADALIESMDVLETAHQIPFPAVFLQCELDRLVPLALQRQVVDLYAGPTRSVVLEGLDHAGIATDVHQAAISSAIDWLWNAS